MPVRSFRKLSFYLVAALAVATVCYAQTARPAPAPALLDAMTDEFEAAATKWETAITSIALRLFVALGTIEFVWTGILLALKGGGLQDFFAEIVRRMLFIGFFLALLLNAHDWSRAIVNGFQRVGAAAVQESVGPALDAYSMSSEGDLKPSAIAAKGIKYSQRVVKAAPSIMRSPGGAVFFGMAGLVVLGGFGAMATRQVMILAEMYVVLSAGVILLGFGASRWTSDYALRYLRYCVSVGVKLMFVQISVAIALHFVDSMISAWTSISFIRASSLTMALGVLVTLIWSIPYIAAQFLQGQSATSGNEVMMSGQLMKAAASAAPMYGPTSGGGLPSSVKMSALHAAFGHTPAGAALGLLGTAIARPANAVGSFARRKAGSPGSDATASPPPLPANDRSKNEGMG